MKNTSLTKHSLEILEARIAPAAVPLGVNWALATHSQDGTPIKLSAGMGLSTGGNLSGDYLLYIEKGNAWVFTTDLNNNGVVDFNEITGIAAGDGLRLISFVDIHGDIVTNLKETPTSAGLQLSLSDSNNNPADDNRNLGGDGRVVLNSRIELIELRTLTTADIPDQNADGVVNDVDVDLRRAPATHSIFGNIYAGGGFGVEGDATSGLLINRTVTTNFGFESETQPMIGSIRVGTAVSGEYFRFSITGGWEASDGTFQQRVRAGIVLGDDVQGYLLPFVPKAGQAGASIVNIRSADVAQTWNLNGLYAGNGGSGAVGGSIINVTINGDDSGGYNIIAGNGGSGTRGGAGGSILGFSDIGSDTSKVEIRSGSGGIGTTGPGGNAGQAEIVDADFYGNYAIVLGDGGSGFTQGGNGASLARAIITQPVPIGTVGGSGWGTSHSPSYYNADPALANPFVARIGTSEAIDFDGDGFGDFVYTSLDTSQVVVMFGDGLGSFRSTLSPQGIAENDRIYLASPRNAESLAVGDLNGDGRPDIVAASADVSNQSGIVVFLSKWEDINKNGSVNDPEDRFLGFYDPRYSPLPQIHTGDPNVLPFPVPPPIGPATEAPHQISELVIGDFDGDGANEIAALVSYYTGKIESNGVITGLGAARPVIMFLSPDRELDTNTQKVFLTGHFYADFGTKRVTTPTAVAPAELRYPLFVMGLPIRVEELILEATALSLDATHDSLILGRQGNDNEYILSTIDYFTRVGSAPGIIGSWNLGQVDTNRNPATTNNPNTNATDIGLLDFAVVDFDGDGDADVVALSQAPNNYMVGIQGNGLGSGIQISLDATGDLDQAGYFLGNVVEARGIKAVDADGDGIVDDFAILINLPTGFVVSVFNFREGAQTGATGPIPAGSLLGVVGDFVSEYRTENIRDGVFWDIFYPIANDLGLPNVAVAPQGGPRIWLTVPPLPEPMAEPKLGIFAGDGGDSFVGRAGNGGFIGGKGKLDTVIIDPTLNITTTDYFGAVQIAFDGGIRLEAGNGGLGFSKGGNGGSITGVSVRDSASSTRIPVASLIAGDGGRGISGAGGQGGDLLANSIYNGRLFFAGDGGDGKTAGRGGSVIGNGLKVGPNRIYDTDTEVLQVYAGTGGNGIKSGGAGGSVVNFRSIIGSNTPTGQSRGALSFVAGNGGNAVSGTGGVGGSILNSSPESSAILEAEVYLEAGRGGNGTRGGAGGNVSGFVLTQSGSSQPAVLSILAGHGGDGTTGAGGKGGSVSAISAISVGDGVPLFPLLGVYPNDPFPSFFGYSRVLAGNGGDSFGGRGGDGGAIVNVSTGATGGTIAIVAGAGGGGLTQGGAGGSVLNSRLEGLSGGAAAKALVVAGAGGDARAFIVNPNDNSPNQGLKAFGGRIGKGGNGGNINGFTQIGDIGAHLDLIAGDGGSTVNYGTVIDKKPFVGRGGSILNVNIGGNVGNMEPATAIRSYNDVLSGETMKDFIERRMRIGESPLETLGDSDGNVGIVVGAAGRNKAVVLDPLGAPYVFVSQPATNAKNGDLMNVHASAIMSAVAGSVDRLAAINLARNISVNAGSLVGADKGVLGVKEYLDTNGNIVPAPVRDGGLIDGAFIARTLVTNPPLIGRIFSF